jgi:hypothetical protein
MHKNEENRNSMIQNNNTTYKKQKSLEICKLYYYCIYEKKVVLHSLMNVIEIVLKKGWTRF